MHIAVGVIKVDVTALWNGQAFIASARMSYLGLQITPRAHMVASIIIRLHFPILCRPYILDNLSFIAANC